MVSPYTKTEGSATNLKIWIFYASRFAVILRAYSLQHAIFSLYESILVVLVASFCNVTLIKENKIQWVDWYVKTNCADIHSLRINPPSVVFLGINRGIYSIDSEERFSGICRICSL